jgi:hypothetical protein
MKSAQNPDSVGEKLHMHYTKDSSWSEKTIFVPLNTKGWWHLGKKKR